MAQRTVVQVFDDLDHQEINGDGRTITFGLDKSLYEIDLSQHNARKLEDALAPFMAAARLVEHGDHAGAGGETPGQVAKMRKWAQEHGLKVNSRGRISKEIKDAYRAAN